VEQFWRLLLNKEDAIVKVPEWRWTEKHVNRVTAEARKTQAGFLKCPVNEFKVLWIESKGNGILGSTAATVAGSVVGSVGGFSRGPNVTEGNANGNLDGDLDTGLCQPNMNRLRIE